MAIEVDPAVEPAKFAHEVERASDAELDELMRSDRRPTIVEAIFRGMPGAFRADRAGPLRAVVHWRISGRGDGGEDLYGSRTWSTCRHPDCAGSPLCHCMAGDLDEGFLRSGRVDVPIAPST